jgi:hypothetical protein
MLIRAVVIALAISASRTLAQDLSADDIVTRHIAARGGDRLRSLQSVIYRNGTYREGSYVGSGNAYMAMAHPFFKVVGDPGDPRSTFREGYDGNAWEWYGSQGFVVRTVGAANAALRHNLDPEGPFVEYRAKGSTIERVPDMDVGGRPAYALRLTLLDGAASLVLIDRETFLITASRKSMPVHAFGDPVTSEERYSDYRAVDGIMFAFRYTETELATGREMSSMHWGTIEVNRDLPREWFSPPVYARTPLQAFLEHLFIERSDTASLRWTYVAFRRAYASVDTHEGVEAIGYQMLKMGDHAGAICVLSLNLNDYPQSSSAAYGLGRAHLAAADTGRARIAFERAVKLDPQNQRAVQALAGIRGRPGAPR